MVKRCSYGTCNADSRYPERLGNAQFHPFPKPARNLEKCMKWIRLCGRPHEQLSLDKLRNHSTAKHIYVCSKHFVDGRPTPAHPDPLPALTDDRSNVKPASRPPKLRTVSVTPRKRLRVDCKPDSAENIRVRCDLQGVSMDITGEMATESLMQDTTAEESTVVTKMATGEDKETDVQSASVFVKGVPQSTPVKQSNTEQSEGIETGLLLILTSPEAVASMTCPSSSGTYIASPPIHCYSSDEPAQSQLKSEENEMEISMLSLHCPSDQKDTSFVPTSSTLTSTPTAKEEIEDEMWKERNWIVNESNLMELFKRCQECGAVITETKKITSGRLIQVQWECEKGHQGQWSSCADVQGMP